MKVRVQPREIDIPEEDPFANDAMDRKEQISVLTNVIKAIDGPCVLSIDGPWGSGKTTFLQMWAQHLRNANFPVVSFNAWETDFSGDPFLALSDEISQALQRYRGGSFDVVIDRVLETTKEVAFRAAPAVIRLLTAGILDVSPILEKELSQAAASYAQERVSAYRGARQSLLSFRDTLQDAARSVSELEDGLPLVVIIDELDRCRPSYAADLLEIAKHLFAVDHVVFVLAVNRDQLSHSICSLYGSDFDGAGYLQRFFDIELRLPEPDRERFIERALGSIQFNDYFERTFDQDARRADRQIRLLFSAFFSTSDVSLRTTNQAIHHLGLVLAALRPDRRFLGLAAAVALILRTMDQSTYREFINGETDAAVVAERISAKIEVNDERWDHQRALFEAVLIIAELEIQNERPRIVADSVPSLLSHHNSVLSTHADGASRDRQVRQARRVVDMVNQFRHEAATGTPPGFLPAAQRLDLLSPDLVGDPVDET